MKKFLVEGRELDNQQMDCVTKMYHNHLVVAGAGTGKTTTIVGKIKWVISKNIFKPSEILVLSFTNASAAEMKERILNETREFCESTNDEVTAATFHKLGLEILKKTSTETKKIAKFSLESFVYKNLCEDEKCLAENITRIISVARMEHINLAEIIKKLETENGFYKRFSRHKITNEDIEILEKSEKISRAYEKELQKRNEIDFSDMINLATKNIEKGLFNSPYKFVIVDEYQDISKPRFEILQALRKSNDYDLFCVGDDWQAIYKFAGSNIDLILNFEKYWGKTKISKIETTYRFPASIADASGKFIMENFSQIPKKIKALPDDTYAVTEICADSFTQTIEKSIEILRDVPKNSTVFYLGRYTKDAGILKMFFKVSTEKIVFRERPDIDIKFLTVHKSKGLQADYVFVMNMKDAKLGFPSKVESSEIMRLIYKDSEKFPYAEERRLFYVAMTRAKKHLYLLTTHERKSEFMTELEDLLYKKMEIIKLGIMEDE